MTSYNLNQGFKWSFERFGQLSLQIVNQRISIILTVERRLKCLQDEVYFFVIEYCEPLCLSQSINYGFDIFLGLINRLLIWSSWHDISNFLDLFLRDTGNLNHLLKFLDDILACGLDNSPEHVYERRIDLIFEEPDTLLRNFTIIQSYEILILLPIGLNLFNSQDCLNQQLITCFLSRL